MTTRELRRHYGETWRALRRTLREVEERHAELGAEDDAASLEAVAHLRALLVHARQALDTLSAEFHAGGEGLAIVAAGLTERGLVPERGRPTSGRESWRERPAENVQSIDALQHQTPPAA